MVVKTKGVKVVGTVTQDGRCPACKKPLVVHDEDGYQFVKNDGIAEFYNGEHYIKCKNCKQFVGRPKIAV